jgi:hypothetical protein
MAAATACSGSHARGSSSLTAVAKAKAEAECPEGNDVEPGILTLRPAGRFTPARSGRARLSSPLPTRLAVAEASPMLATPTRAARRGRPGVLIIDRQLQQANLIYGVFAVVIVLLPWLYLSAQLLLYAAEINVVL